MRRYYGSGTVFLEIDGSAYVYNIPDGEYKIVNTGYIAAMTEGGKMEIQTVKGISNVLFGGEGLFNTVVKGPCKIIMQSIPIYTTAMTLYGYMPHSSK